MNIERIVSFGLGAAMLALAAPTAEAQDEHQTSAAVGRVRDAYISALNNKDAAAIAELYAEDGQLTDQFGNHFEGRDAILKGLTEAAPTWGHFVVKPGELMQSGNVVWEMGVLLMHINAEDGSMMEIKNHYLAVLGMVGETWRLKALVFGAPPPEM